MAQAKAIPASPYMRLLAGASPATIRDLGVPIAVLAIVVTLVTPVPPFLLDLLIVVDIMLSVVVLMVAMYITRPVEFSVFPTTLLLLTLFRLALNISSTRLILMNGNTGTGAAGHVIEAFGQFVVGGNYIIGTVIFLVLIAIQYVVINHGAVRISEVTARFTLDALPGKQMSIDSDLNSGMIDDTEARRRRKELAAEAEFYGAMDGASRFTQRDAVASVLITSINILAGLLIGIFQHGMLFRRALETYTVLTIGDGLVTVVPALMISISGGLIVTRASSDARLGADFHRQVFSKAQPLLLASCVLLTLAGFPGLPKIPFLIVGLGMGFAAIRMRQRTQAEQVSGAAEPQARKENVEALLHVEPLSVEIGLGLLKLIEGGADSPLLRRIAGIRRQLASELGYILPPIRVMDNVTLRSREYVIHVKGAEISRYELAAGSELAIPIRPAEPPRKGRQTVEPAFGMTAWWIPAEEADAARRNGFTTIDGISVLATHLSEVIRKYCWELFSRQDAKRFLDRVALQDPKVVEDLVPKLLPLAAVQKVLQNLLRERVSVRDGVSIAEALSDAAAITRNPVLLTEYVRQNIRRTLVKPYLNRAGDLPAYVFDPGLEQSVETHVQHGEHGSQLEMPPQAIQDIMNRIKGKVGDPEAAVVAITTSGARHFIRQIAESCVRNLFVVSHNEVPAEVKIISLGVIT